MSVDLLEALEREIVVLEARYGGHERASRLLAARRRAQELRALAMAVPAVPGDSAEVHEVRGYSE